MKDWRDRGGQGDAVWKEDVINIKCFFIKWEYDVKWPILATCLEKKMSL